MPTRRRYTQAELQEIIPRPKFPMPNEQMRMRMQHRENLKKGLSARAKHTLNDLVKDIPCYCTYDVEREVCQYCRDLGEIFTLRKFKAERARARKDA